MYVFWALGLFSGKLSGTKITKWKFVKISKNIINS